MDHSPEGGPLWHQVAAAHQQLGNLWQLHREAVIERDAGIAGAALNAFADLLRLHIDVENRHLFSMHEQWCEQPRWRVPLYLQEHDKLLRLLERLLRQWQPGAVLTRHAVLDWLEQLRPLAHLMEHHELREERALLVELEAALPKAVQVELLGVLETAWGKQHAVAQQFCRQWRAQLPDEP